MSKNVTIGIEINSLFTNMIIRNGNKVEYLSSCKLIPTCILVQDIDTFKFGEEVIKITSNECKLLLFRFIDLLDVYNEGGLVDFIDHVFAPFKFDDNNVLSYVINLPNENIINITPLKALVLYLTFLNSKIKTYMKDNGIESFTPIFSISRSRSELWMSNFKLAVLYAGIENAKFVYEDECILLSDIISKGCYDNGYVGIITCCCDNVSYFVYNIDKAGGQINSYCLVHNEVIHSINIPDFNRNLLALLMGVDEGLTSYSETKPVQLYFTLIIDLLRCSSASGLIQDDLLPLLNAISGNVKLEYLPYIDEMRNVMLTGPYLKAFEGNIHIYDIVSSSSESYMDSICNGLLLSTFTNGNYTLNVSECASTLRLCIELGDSPMIPLVVSELPFLKRYSFEIEAPNKMIEFQVIRTYSCFSSKNKLMIPLKTDEKHTVELQLEMNRDGFLEMSLDYMDDTPPYKSLFSCRFIKEYNIIFLVNSNIFQDDKLSFIDTVRDVISLLRIHGYSCTYTMSVYGNVGNLDNAVVYPTHDPNTFLSKVDSINNGDTTRTFLHSVTSLLNLTFFIGANTLIYHITNLSENLSDDEVNMLPSIPHKKYICISDKEQLFLDKIHDHRHFLSTEIENIPGIICGSIQCC